MRLFVAVDLPDDAKNGLEQMRAEIPGAAWVKRHALHLTLQFLGGDIPGDRLPEIVEALRTVRMPPFALRLQGVGRFGSRQSPRVLWVGMAQNGALTDLYRQVTRAMSPLGFAPDERGFNPHITLARLKQPQSGRPVEAFLARHADFQTEPFMVHEFVLFSSVLRPEGSVYTREAVFPLTGP